MLQDMENIFNKISGVKILEEVNSPINGKISVIKSLAFGTYIQVDGITQSGGLVEDIWRQTLKKIHNSYPLIHNSLILGLGGGSAAKLIQKKWPKAKIIGVETDPLMVELGKKFLGLNKTKLQIKIQDAFKYLILNTKYNIHKFDLILIDLYLGRDFPKKFESDVFLRLILRLLTDNGVAVFNHLYYDEKRSEAMKFGKKLEKIFPEVDYIYPEANILFLCWK
jgi:spermidine synthase